MKHPTEPPDRSIFVYPWDLIDAGVHVTLERIREMAFNQISLAVSYHGGKFLLPHNPKKTVYYHPSGRVYFTPRLERYKTLRPVPGETSRGLYTEGDMLQHIIEAAQNVGLAVRGWIVGTHNSRLGRNHPECTIRNLYGEAYYHALCPSKPETKHYLLQMVRDLLDQYDLCALDLESFDFMGMLHGDHHEIVGVPAPELVERILGLCYCSSCVQRAINNGIDVSRLMKELRTALQQVFRLESAERIGRTLEGVPGYIDYLVMRRDVVEDLIRSVRHEIDVRDAQVSLYSICWIADGADPTFYGNDTTRLSRYLDGWILCYPTTPDEIGRFVQRAREMVNTEIALSGGIRVLAPEISSRSDVRAYLEYYEKAGIQDYHVYNYGLAGETVLKEVGRYLIEHEHG